MNLATEQLHWNTAPQQEPADKYGETFHFYFLFKLSISNLGALRSGGVFIQGQTAEQSPVSISLEHNLSQAEGFCSSTFQLDWKNISAPPTPW